MSTKRNINKQSILIHSKSPNCCNIKVDVVEYNGCVYFNLYKKEVKVRSCWIINYEKPPIVIDSKIKNPLLSIDYCLSKGENKKLNPKELKIVWFEEGDGAALLNGNDIICVIPNCEDSECPGYSKECVKKSKYAYPLGDEYNERVHKSKEFWNDFDDHSWERIQDQYIEEIERKIGNCNKYYAIDGGQWPPKAIVTIERDNVVYLVTIGVSVIPQPTVDKYYENPSEYRRFEFGFAINKDLFDNIENDILGYISGQTSLPWNQLTFVSHGHTIPCNIISQFSYMLLIKDDNLLQLPLYRGDLINVLWMVPISLDEQQQLKKYGSIYMIEKFSQETNLLVFNNDNKFKNIK